MKLKREKRAGIDDMADTNILKCIEQHVREWCKIKYATECEDSEIELRLVTGGAHRFDIVSKNRSIIGGMKTSALRDNGKIGGGVIKSTYAELYYLNLIDAAIKVMILTDEGYYKYFRRIATGKVAGGIEIVHCSLPREIQEKVAAVHRACRKEIGKK